MSMSKFVGHPKRKNEMKILYCVYHNLETEERSAEVFEILKKIGYVDIVSCTKNIKGSDDCKSIYATKYISYLKNCLLQIIKSDYDIISLHDNHDSILIPIIKLKHRKQFVVYDSSEFYPVEDLYRINLRVIIKVKGYILREIERIFLRKADFVIAANYERAEAMKEYYKLKMLPYIYDNIHIIRGSYNEIECEKKYQSLFSKNTFTILNAGGIDKDRDIYEIAEAVMKLGKKYSLVVAGSATKDERERFERRYKDVDNIKYIGFVPRNHLKYLYQNSDVSFTAFKKSTMNNIFCASGKTYESIFEGTPIISSNNPPLKRLCEEYLVGIANDEYVDAIKEIHTNYNIYKSNVEKFRNNYNSEEKKMNLFMEIMKAYKSKCNL